MPCPQGKRIKFYPMLKYIPLLAAVVYATHCTAKKPVSLAAGVAAELQLKNIKLQIMAKPERILVTEISENRALLELSLRDTFATVRRAEDRVTDKMASFKMAEKEKERCELLHIKSADADAKSITVRGRLNCIHSETDIDLSFTPEKDRVILELKPHDARFNRIQLKFLAHDNEAIFGGGEQFTHLNLRGRRFAMLSEEQGIGRGAEPITTGANVMAGAGGNDTTTYTPIPFFMTSTFRSFDSEQTAYQIWDFQTHEYSVEVWDNALKLNFFTATTFEKLLSTFTARTGRMAPLPDWAHGTIFGLQGGKDKVEQAINAALKEKNPISAIWIQDWVGRRQTSFGSQLWWRWLPDEKAYPDFRNWVASLRLRGIRVLGYINPFLADEGPIFEEARKQGYLVRNKKYEPYKIQTAGFPAYLIDLSNSAARSYVKEIIKKNMLAAGLAGYMADFGEWLPWDASLKSEEHAAHWHNRYPVEWARLNREAIREAGLEGQVVFFTRAGYAGSAAESILFWAGDQMVSFDEYDGLASAITGILTGGISGITLNHSDIGGYTTINNPLKNYHRSRELFLRWAEFAVFTPFFRTHEGNRPEKNYQAYSDETIVREFASLGRTHRALAPYFAALEAEAASRGLPLLRPLFLHYPQDRNTYELRHEFMLGRDLIVAPVTEKQATMGRIYLPQGTWLDSETGAPLAGNGWHTFAAPLGRAKGFIRSGSANEKLLREALAVR